MTRSKRQWKQCWDLASTAGTSPPTTAVGLPRRLLPESTDCGHPRRQHYARGWPNPEWPLWSAQWQQAGVC